MSIAELMPSLRELDRGDKLRAMQFLLEELAREEGALFVPGADYPVWSPYSANEAADTLLAALNSGNELSSGSR